MSFWRNLAIFHRKLSKYVEFATGLIQYSVPSCWNWIERQYGSDRNTQRSFLYISKNILVRYIIEMKGIFCTPLETSVWVSGLYPTFIVVLGTLINSNKRAGSHKRTHPCYNLYLTRSKGRMNVAAHVILIRLTILLEINSSARKKLSYSTVTAHEPFWLTCSLSRSFPWLPESSLYSFSNPLVSFALDRSRQMDAVCFETSSAEYILEYGEVSRIVCEAKRF